MLKIRNHKYPRIKIGNMCLNRFYSFYVLWEFHFGTESLISAKKRAWMVILSQDVSGEQALPAPSWCLQHLPPFQLPGESQIFSGILFLKHFSVLFLRNSFLKSFLCFSPQATNQANANELWLTIKEGKGNGGESNLVFGKLQTWRLSNLLHKPLF